MEQPGFVFFPPQVSRRARLVFGVPLSLVTLAIAVWCPWLVWAPRSIDYAVADGTLTVTSGAAPLRSERVVAAGDISEVRSVRLEGGRRVAGTALPGYCVGHFHYRNVGPVWQASDCSREAVLVVVRGEERALVLTPPQRESFLAALEERGSYRAPPLRPRPGSWTWTLGLLMVPLPILAVVVPLIFFVAPGRLRYRIVPGWVEIRTILRTRRLPTHGLRARFHQPRVGARLLGAALPGYYTGWFVVDGRRARVYATQVKAPGVLLTAADGGRVFVNPSEPDRFLVTLRETGVEVETQ